MPKTDGVTSRCKQPCSLNNEGNTSLKETKCSCDPRKMPAEMYFNEETEIDRHNLVIPKPWVSPSFSVENSNSISKDILVSDSKVFEEFRPVSVKPSPYTLNIYDIFHNTETN